MTKHNGVDHEALNGKEKLTIGETKRKIRYAVIGLGHIAQNAALPGIANAKENSELVALVSDSPKKLEEVGSMYGVEGRYSYDELEECLKKERVDAVYIATPNSVHATDAMTAINAGVHVLCEKPLTTSLEDAYRMQRNAEEKGVYIMTAYRLHFDKANMEVVKLLREKKIGEPKIFTSVFGYQIASGNVRLDGALGGGSLYDLGIYPINAARYLFREEPRWVAGRLAKHEDRRFTEVDGSCSALLLFSDNKVAQFTSSFSTADSGYYEVIGAEGTIRLEQAYEYSEGSELIVTAEGKTETRSFKKHDQFSAEFLYFSDCILKGRKPEPSAAEGIADLQVIEAIHESSRTGQFVSVESIRGLERPDESQVITKRVKRKPRKLIDVSAPHIN